MAKSFHCDFCGEAVRPDEERCPGCGRFFRAVKCPVCSYTAKGEEFLHGCPSCGYLTDVEKKRTEDQKKNKRDFLNISKLFAYGAITILSLLLIYFLYLYSRI